MLTFKQFISENTLEEVFDNPPKNIMLKDGYYLELFDETKYTLFYHIHRLMSELDEDGKPQVFGRATWNKGSLRDFDNATWAVRSVKLNTSSSKDVRREECTLSGFREFVNSYIQKWRNERLIEQKFSAVPKGICFAARNNTPKRWLLSRKAGNKILKG